MKFWQAKECKGEVLVRVLKNEAALCKPDLSDTRQDGTGNSCEGENKNSGCKEGGKFLSDYYLLQDFAGRS